VRKIDAPTHDPLVVYDICVNAVGDPALQKTYIENRSHVGDTVDAFNNATVSATWVNLPRVGRGKFDTKIAGTLTKKHFLDLYNDSMVAKEGPARNIYDTIFVCSGGWCPFCGGIGHVKTLDHYLPKSNFPAYSILPVNLVPCCRDCNTGKSNSSGTGIHEQTLHPYLDDTKYFDERWISAVVSKTNPIVMTFRCSPPPSWSCSDQQRVQQHFKRYDLAYRFRLQAGSEVPQVLNFRCNSLQALSPQKFKAYLLDNANNSDLDMNGWIRTMYAALSETEWFCSADFADPLWHSIIGE
jgi:hypothetical protein